VSPAERRQSPSYRRKSIKKRSAVRTYKHAELPVAESAPWIKQLIFPIVLIGKLTSDVGGGSGAG